ncbi:DMT family transporter [Pseudolysinimonas yzui]|uniref:Membrane protein n=1 Tax=Pseudolysinimonas yzui TaxID=2708254 RepID=A0A8J3GN68_9MICO|nr:DMT family transporter [Pseudolysinimonas yzui]GHF06039.1 membrane protein [Pseudolysinimonas yzui]
MTSSRWLLLGAVAFTFLAWASAFVVIRGVGPYLDGGPLALGRLAVGVVALGIAVLIARRWVWPTRREWLQLAIYGVAWFGAYNVALNTAEQTLDAGTAAMIVGIGPILIALGAGIFLGEGIPKWLAIGAAVAFAGVVLIGVGTMLAQGGAHPVDLLGAVLALVAAITYAVGAVTQKPVVRRIPAIQATFLGCAIGLVVCLPFTGVLVEQLAVAPASAWWGTLYLGIVPTALAFTTWAYALGRMPAGQLGIASYLSPPLATVMGFLAFGEIPHPLALAGGVICLLGVAVSRRRPRVPVPA